MVLALLALLLQSATVAAHGLMPVPAAGPDAIALCTPYGVKIVHVDADGNPVAPTPPAGDDCTLCLHAAGGHAVVPALAVTAVVTDLAAAVALPAGLPHPPAVYRAQNPRGPPGRG